MQNHASKSVKKIAPVAAVAFVATMLVGAFSFTTTAYAAVTFDPDTGEGFVGKGDVQTALNLNNKQLQQQAGSLEFTAESTVVTEVSWECTRFDRDGNPTEQTQERERTTTTTIEGVLSSVARERNQITGFTLTGYDGDPSESSTTEGPAVGSCPTNWQVTEGPSDPETISEESRLLVNGVPL